MSTIDNIINKLLINLKNEITKKDNMDIINKDIINPIVNSIINDIYPYFLVGCILFAIFMIILFMILFFNIKIYYS